ncbi:MAG: ChbG/HpnK family deacetylase [Elusimicrobia bacterium]|nr:ChbG/HpnK family deacetylase [Candidatus Liberimonas magnetica]
MKKLIINADDFGYRENVNKGVIYAHKNGLVTSASLFVDKESTPEAVRLAKENSALGLGLHVDLDKYFEIDHTLGQIVKMYDQNQDINELKSEVRRQLDKFYSFGFQADHIDSHHHAHLHPKVFTVVCELAKEFKIPVVRIFEKFYLNRQDFENSSNICKDNGLKTVDHFIEGWYWGNIDENYVLAELMTHPGYGEIWREAELANCCQPKLKDYLIAQKIELVRFSDMVNG